MHERIETSNVYHTCAYVRFRLWPQWAWLRGKGAFTNQRDYISSVLLCVCSERQHREFKWSSRRLSAYLCSYFFAMINALNSVNRQPCSFKLVNALVQVQIKLICKCTVASNQARWAAGVKLHWSLLDGNKSGDKRKVSSGDTWGHLKCPPRTLRQLEDT